MFEYERKIQYYETDQMKIVHHSNYIKWFEEARIESLAYNDFDYHSLEEAGLVSPVLSININYKKACQFGETVIIRLKLVEFKGVKFKMSYEVVEKESGELRATGETEHAFLSAETGRPVRLKRDYPKLYDFFKESIE